MNKRKADSESSNDQPIEKKQKVEEKDEFECPVCFELMVAPIWQCYEGHVLCGKCREKIVPFQCPVCKCTDCGGRNRFMESQTEKVERECPQGCGVKTTIAKLLGDHKKECAKGERYYCICGCSGVEAKSVAELKDHVVKKHSHFISNTVERYTAHDFCFKSTSKSWETIWTRPNLEVQARVTLSTPKGDEGDRCVAVYFECMPVSV